MKEYNSSALETSTNFNPTIQYMDCPEHIDSTHEISVEKRKCTESGKSKFDDFYLPIERKRKRKHRCLDGESLNIYSPNTSNIGLGRTENEKDKTSNNKSPEIIYDSETKSPTGDVENILFEDQLEEGEEEFEDVDLRASRAPWDSLRSEVKMRKKTIQNGRKKSDLTNKDLNKGTHFEYVGQGDSYPLKSKYESMQKERLCIETSALQNRESLERSMLLPMLAFYNPVWCLWTFPEEKNLKHLPLIHPPRCVRYLEDKQASSEQQIQRRGFLLQQRWHRKNEAAVQWIESEGLVMADGYLNKKSCRSRLEKYFPEQLKKCDIKLKMTASEVSEILSLCRKIDSFKKYARKIIKWKSSLVSRKQLASRKKRVKNSEESTDEHSIIIEDSITPSNVDDPLPKQSVSAASSMFHTAASNLNIERSVDNRDFDDTYSKPSVYNGLNVVGLSGSPDTTNDSPKINEGVDQKCGINKSTNEDNSADISSMVPTCPIVDCEDKESMTEIDRTARLNEAENNARQNEDEPRSSFTCNSEHSMKDSQKESADSSSRQSIRSMFEKMEKRNAEMEQKAIEEAVVVGKRRNRKKTCVAVDDNEFNDLGDNEIVNEETSSDLRISPCEVNSMDDSQQDLPLRIVRPQISKIRPISELQEESSLNSHRIKIPKPRSKELSLMGKLLVDEEAEVASSGDESGDSDGTKKRNKQRSQNLAEEEEEEYDEDENVQLEGLIANEEEEKEAVSVGWSSDVHEYHLKEIEKAENKALDLFTFEGLERRKKRRGHDFEENDVFGNEGNETTKQKQRKIENDSKRWISSSSETEDSETDSNTSTDSEGSFSSCEERDTNDVILSEHRKQSRKRKGRKIKDPDSAKYNDSQSRKNLRETQLSGSVIAESPKSMPSNLCQNNYDNSLESAAVFVASSAHNNTLGFSNISRGRNFNSFFQRCSKPIPAGCDSNSNFKHSDAHKSEKGEPVDSTLSASWSAPFSSHLNSTSDNCRIEDSKASHLRSMENSSNKKKSNLIPTQGLSSCHNPPKVNEFMRRLRTIEDSFKETQTRSCT